MYTRSQPEVAPCLGQEYVEEIQVAWPGLHGGLETQVVGRHGLKGTG